MFRLSMPAIWWSPAIRWSPAIWWPIRSMDFDKPKVYGDTSITDGLVSLDKKHHTLTGSGFKSIDLWIRCGYGKLCGGRMNNFCRAHKIFSSENRFSTQRTDFGWRRRWQCYNHNGYQKVMELENVNVLAHTWMITYVIISVEYTMSSIYYSTLYIINNILY